MVRLLAMAKHTSRDSIRSATISFDAGFDDWIVSGWVWGGCELIVASSWFLGVSEGSLGWGLAG